MPTGGATNSFEKRLDSSPDVAGIRAKYQLHDHQM